MPAFRLVLFVLYLSYVLSSGSTHTKQGSGWDPSGLSATTPASVNGDQGSGWDPNG
jgi:hypothetical protein